MSEDDAERSSASPPSHAREDDDPLAAVVAKDRADVALESLREECVYDGTRRIREYDDDSVAVPVTEAPATTRVREVIRQVDPEPRTRDLADLLVERGWSEADLERAPGSWAVIGSVILASFPEECPDERAVGEALLELHGEADVVLADEGIANEGEAGRFRTPKTRRVAGDGDTETVHAEHGSRYALDPATVMFSPGNAAERARMGEVVGAGASDGGPTSGDPDATERVFDMFAGIGYFTLPMARAGARVTAAEINPTAFRYLLENAVLNDVSDRIDAYCEDCRDVAAGVTADRVVMGYYGSDASDGSEDGPRVDEAHEFLASALDALEPGGVLHYHEATPEALLWDRPLERLETGVDRASRTLAVLEKRRVKSHSEGVSHVVIDARVD